MNAAPITTKAEHPGDTQKVELLGRNRLIDELLRDDLEVALPVRDRGIDVIAYVDLISATAAYVARPIQMKAAWTRSFMIDKRYSRFAGLILAYVWHLDDRERAVTFAMSYEEAVGVADTMGWTKTESWSRGAYSTSNPSARLTSLLEPYRMGQGKWRPRILGRLTPTGAPDLVTTPRECF